MLNGNQLNFILMGKDINPKKYNQQLKMQTRVVMKYTN